MTAGREPARGNQPPPGRCLVLALDGIGDMVLRQPLLRGLADAGREVHVLVQATYEALPRLLDERLRAVPAPLEWTRPPSVLAVRKLFERLQRLDPALVVSAQFNPVCYADWILRSLPGAFRAGFAGGAGQDVPGARLVEARLALPAGRPLDLAVACEESLSEVEKALRLMVAVTGNAPALERPHLVLDARARARGLEVLHSRGLSAGAFAVVYPAGTRNVTIKAWPAERFARIAAWLARERSLPTLVIGHTSETEVVEAVASAARAGGGHVNSWCGGEEDLEALTGLVGLARLYVGNDTGPMHLAAAAGVPVVAVFGGGHWPRFLPVASHGAVHTRKLPCFGCGWRDCFFADGPCVGHVEEEAVRGSLVRLLERDGGFEVHDEPLPLGESDWARAVTTFRALSSRTADLLEEGLRAREGPRAWRRLRAALTKTLALARSVLGRRLTE